MTTATATLRRVVDSKTPEARPNEALKFLTWLGVLALLVGTIGTFTSRASAVKEADTEALARAMIADSGSYAGDWRAVVPDYTVSWVFAGVAVLGVLMLVGALMVKAARA